MTTINSLSAITAFDADDKLPVWQAANGDTRSGTVGLLTEYIAGVVGENDIDDGIGEPANLATGMAAPETVANLAAPSTTGWQGYDFDPVGGYIYATNIDPVAVPDTITVCRFDMAGNLLDQATATTTLGHGADLGLEYQTDGSVRLWTGNAAGNGATRFAYNAGAAISDVQNYVLFSGYTTTQVGVSYGGRYVVAQAGASGVRKVRVFDLARLIAGGPGDYSADFLFEFELDSAQSSPPFQGITADDLFVYTLSGTSSISNDKLIYVYTLAGALVAAYPAVQVGKASAAASGPGTYWEPEGLAWMTTASGAKALTVGMAQAGGMKLWGLGAGLYHHITAPGGILLDLFNGGQIFCNNASGRSVFTLRGGKTTTGSAVLLYGDTDPTNPGRLQLQCRDVGGAATRAIAFDPTTSSFRPATGNVLDLGNTTVPWNKVVANTVRTIPSTVAALPAAGTVGAGTRAFVTDANATTFASVVASGGANPVPVYSDGTNWRIG